MTTPRPAGPHQGARGLLGPLLALAAAAALGACSRDAPMSLPQAPKPAVVEAPGTAEGEGAGPERKTASLDGVGGGPARPTTEAEQLELRLTVRNDEVNEGEPVIAEIEIRNVSDHATVLISPEELLVKRVRLKVREGKSYVAVGNARAMEGEVSEFELEPRHHVGVRVNVQPLLERTRSYEQGLIHFQVVYAGHADLMPSSPRAWNRSGECELESNEARVEIVRPEASEELGIDEDVYGEVVNAVVRWRPGSSRTAELVARLRELGPEALRSLAALNRDLGSPVEERSLRGGRAMLLLREFGLQARLILDGAPATDQPPLVMTKALLDADANALARRSLGEAGDALAAAGGSDVLVIVALEASQERQPFRLVLDHRGYLMIERTRAGELERGMWKLAPSALGRVRAAFVDSRMWCWKQTRDTLRADEGTLRVEVRRGERSLVRLTMPELEALRENPLPASLLDALANVESDLRSARTAMRKEKEDSGR